MKTKHNNIQIYIFFIIVVLISLAIIFYSVESISKKPSLSSNSHQISLAIPKMSVDSLVSSTKNQIDSNSIHAFLFLTSIGCSPCVTEILEFYEIISLEMQFSATLIYLGESIQKYRRFHLSNRRKERFIFMEKKRFVKLFNESDAINAIFFYDKSNEIVFQKTLLPNTLITSLEEKNEFLEYVFNH